MSYVNTTTTTNNTTNSTLYNAYSWSTPAWYTGGTTTTIPNVYLSPTPVKEEPMEFKLGNDRSKVFTLLYVGNKKVPTVKVYNSLVEKDEVSGEVTHTHKEIRDVDVEVCGKQVTLEFKTAPRKNSLTVSID